MNVEEILRSAWSALESGNLARGRELAASLLEQEAVPEAHFLLALAARQENDLETAERQCQQAISLDEEYPDALLFMAELEADSGEFETALSWAERALNAADEEDEYLNALLFKAELESLSEQVDEAATTLKDFPSVDLEEPDYHLRAASLFLAIGDVTAAKAQFEAALRQGATAEAHHGLGLCAEQVEDAATQVSHFLQTRALDLAEPADHRLTAAEIETLVEQAIAKLPPRCKSLLENVPIVVEDYPSEPLVRDGVDPRVLGLFVGQPFPAQSTLGPPPSLTQILLFQRNIEREAATPEAAEEEILITLLHEIGHFFGMDEEDLEELGLD